MFQNRIKIQFGTCFAFNLFRKGYNDDRNRDKYGGHTDLYLFPVGAGVIKSEDEHSLTRQHSESNTNVFRSDVNLILYNFKFGIFVGFSNLNNLFVFICES